MWRSNTATQTVNMIGMMIVGAGFLYVVTEGLLWLEGYFAINS
jgi:hypothetical protein